MAIDINEYSLNAILDKTFKSEPKLFHDSPCNIMEAMGFKEILICYINNTSDRIQLFCMSNVEAKYGMKDAALIEKLH